jgi:glycosyltransferase involved in cell wall biosynthesis
MSTPPGNRKSATGSLSVCTPPRQVRTEVGPVLLVTPWHRPAVGGVVEVADSLWHRLRGAGIRAHLLVSQEDEEKPHHPVRADPTANDLWRFHVAAYAITGLGLRSIFGTLFRAPLCLWRLLRFIRTQHIRTIVLIYPDASAWPFLLVHYILRVRLVTSWHGNDIWPYRRFPTLLRLLLRQVLRASAAITIPAPHLAQRIQEVLPGALLPIRHIRNCIDVSHFVPPPPSVTRTDSRPTVIHVSNFNPKKRVVDIVEALSDPTIPPSTRLVMVGTGPHFERAIQCAHRLGLEDRVEFVGATEDVRPYLWNADVFVLASDEESGPLALLEAMACGLPWVATPWGVAAMLPAGECGLTVPCRSPQALARALSELLNDPARRKAMGIRARARAEAEFEIGWYINAHIALLTEIQRGGQNG